MFTKEILIAMFKKNKTLNFCVYTNLGEGGGINGVSFASFIGEGIEEKHIIKGFADSYMVIEKTNSGAYFSGAKKDIYLPYECIVRVDFITDTTHTYYKFNGKHNLKEIK